MARIRHLDRAPIEEAVVELRVRSAGSIEFGQLANLADHWKSAFPVKQTVQAVAATFGIQDGKPLANTQQQELGYLLKAENQRDVVQFRRDAFVFSQLRPYSSWEELLPRATELWESYRDTMQPERLVRLGVRYVNRLRFTLPVDLARYLSSPPSSPRTPDGLPLAIRAYLTRLVLQDSDSGNSITILQASEPSTDRGHVTVLLDVDAFRDVDIDPKDDDVIPVLEDLRRLKNQAFFGSITEDTAEMYE